MAKLSGYSVVAICMLLPDAGPMLRTLSHGPFPIDPPPADEPLLERFGYFSPETLLDDLKAGGYELVATDCAFWPTGKKYRYNVRFIFAHKNDKVLINQRFAQVRSEIEQEIAHALQTGVWRRIRIFQKPIIDGGKEVAGALHTTVALGQWQPYCHSDGEPVMIQPTDSEGTFIGDVFPVAADYSFVLTENAFHFMDVAEKRDS